MASFTTTTHTKFIPAVWAKEAQIKRESKLIMANLVERHDVDVADNGSVIHIPIVTNLTAASIGSDGSLTDSANTESEVTITVATWVGVSFNVPDILAAQSKYNLFELYSKKMGYALGLKLEQDMLALYSSLSGSYVVGTSSVDLTDAVLRLAVQKLDDNLVPMDDRHLVIKPAQRNALLGIDKFVRYDAVSYAEGASPIVKGNIGQLYGVEVHVSPNIAAGPPAQNLMFHRSAFGLAMQRDIKVEKFARTQFADRMGASELYGNAILRDDHAIQVQS